MSARAACALALATACTAPAGALRSAAPAPARAAAPGPPPRRLSRAEYRNTIADLFGVAPPAAGDLPEDGVDDGFTTTRQQHLGAAAWRRYDEVAAEIASGLARRLPRYMPCATDGLDEASCVRRFLETTGTRIYRRRLAPDELAALARLFAERRAAGDGFPAAATALLRTMLASPQFLFLWERPGPGARADRLDDWQLAARLSYALWRTTPDALLLEAAAGGELHEPSTLAAHAARLLDDDRARPTVAAFFDEWLGLERIEAVEKDPGKHPGVDKGLLIALARETRKFLADTFWRDDGRLGALFVSPMRVRNRALSRFYGDELATAEDLKTTTAPPTERSFGLLSQAGLLMAMGPNDETAIIHRGKFVGTRLLCRSLPPPPPGVPPLPAIEPGMSGRERVEAHTGGPRCYGCHSEINPPGYALEHFDGAGRWRDAEAGRPIDATAEIEGTDIDGTVDGALDLSRQMARSHDVERCAAQRLFTFAFARQPAPGDAGTVDDLTAGLHTSGGSLKELLLALVESPAFGRW